MEAVRPLDELVEEVVSRLTSEQLYAIAARVAAAETVPCSPSEPFDLAAAVTFDLDAAVRRAAARWVDGTGIDPDLFASWYLPQLVRAGASEIDALAALQRVTGWRPRTEAERFAAVARDLLVAGYPAEHVRRALRAVA